MVKTRRIKPENRQEFEQGRVYYSSDLGVEVDLPHMEVYGDAICVMEDSATIYHKGETVADIPKHHFPGIHKDLERLERKHPRVEQ